MVFKIYFTKMIFTYTISRQIYWPWTYMVSTACCGTQSVSHLLTSLPFFIQSIPMRWSRFMLIVRGWFDSLRGASCRRRLSLWLPSFLLHLPRQAALFVLTPVLDGDFRNHSKRATTKRRAMREISRINAVQNRFKALSVSSKINSGTATQEKRKNLMSWMQRQKY